MHLWQKSFVEAVLKYGLVFFGSVAATVALVFRVIYRALNAGRETRLVAVASDRPDEVAGYVFRRLGKTPRTIIDDSKTPMADTSEKPELYFNVSHHEIAFLESVVYDVDRDATIYIK